MTNRALIIRKENAFNTRSRHATAQYSLLKEMSCLFE